MTIERKASIGTTTDRPCGFARMSRAPLVFGFLLMVSAAAGAQKLAFDDLGPLRIRDQFLLGMGFLAFDPESADVLRAGQWQLDLIETGTNSFAKSQVIERALEARSQRGPVTLAFLEAAAASDLGTGAFYLDGELYRTAIAVRRGIGRSLQVGLTLQILDAGGGRMDGLVESFHDTFGLGQAGRLGAPRNRSTIFVESKGREVFADRNFESGLGDLSASAKYGLTAPESPWNASVEGIFKVPAGREQDFYSSGSIDLGAQLLMSRFFDRSCFHGSIGVLRLGKSDRLGVPSQTLFSGMVGYERGIFNSDNSVIAQVTVSQSPFRTLDLAELGEISIQASLGAKCAIGKRRVLFVALTENIAHFNNTADIGFHVGWTERF